MTTSRLRLGQLLVDARLITQEALEEVLASQKKDGRRLGTLLVEQGHISEVQLTQILSHQLSVPWVSLLKIEFSRQLLNLVPRELAEQYCVLPIFVRRVRGQGETLYIAMDDPTNEEALRACSAYAGLPVRPMIAPPSDVRSAIRAYYGAPAAETAREGAAAPAAPQPAPAPAVQAPPEPPAEDRVAATPPPPAARPPSHQQTLRSAVFDEGAAAAGVRAVQTTEAPRTGSVPPTAHPPAKPPPPPAEDDPVIELTAPRSSRPSVPPDSRPPAPRDSRPSAPPDSRPPAPRDSRPSVPPDSKPVPIPSPRGKTPRMVSLTLLDGTTLTLPARRQKRPSDPTLAQRASEAPPEGPTSLTARDLVGALRAVANGADASAILGEDVRWESMFAALLSVLLKKQLIADWEFVEELNKLQKKK